MSPSVIKLFCSKYFSTHLFASNGIFQLDKSYFACTNYSSLHFLNLLQFWNFRLSKSDVEPDCFDEVLPLFENLLNFPLSHLRSNVIEELFRFISLFHDNFENNLNFQILRMITSHEEIQLNSELLHFLSTEGSFDVLLQLTKRCSYIPNILSIFKSLDLIHYPSLFLYFSNLNSDLRVDGVSTSSITTVMVETDKRNTEFNLELASNFKTVSSISLLNNSSFCCFFTSKSKRTILTSFAQEFQFSDDFDFLYHTPYFLNILNFMPIHNLNDELINQIVQIILTPSNDHVLRMSLLKSFDQLIVSLIASRNQHNLSINSPLNSPSLSQAGRTSSTTTLCQDLFTISGGVSAYKIRSQLQVDDIQILLKILDGAVHLVSNVFLSGSSFDIIVAAVELLLNIWNFLPTPTQIGFVSGPLTQFFLKNPVSSHFFNYSELFSVFLRFLSFIHITFLDKVPPQIQSLFNQFLKFCRPPFSILHLPAIFDVFSSLISANQADIIRNSTDSLTSWSLFNFSQYFNFVASPFTKYGFSLVHSPFFVNDFYFARKCCLFLSCVLNSLNIPHCRQIFNFFLSSIPQQPSPTSIVLSSIQSALLSRQIHIENFVEQSLGFFNNTNDNGIISILPILVSLGFVDIATASTAVSDLLVETLKFDQFLIDSVANVLTFLTSKDQYVAVTSILFSKLSAINAIVLLKQLLHMNSDIVLDILELVKEILLQKEDTGALDFLNQLDFVS
ncbi:hypothetical protein GEMRC1_003090 [Eukaryota sp. GEM-RC1]